MRADQVIECSAHVMAERDVLVRRRVGETQNQTDPGLLDAWTDARCAITVT